MTAPHIPESPAATASGDPASRFSVAAPLAWLGGADTGPIDRHERSGYAVGGAAVLLFAAVSGVVVAAATGAAHWPPLGVAIATLLTVLLVAAGSRALSTPSSRTLSTAALPGRRGRLIGRVVVAVLAGVVIAELAGTVLLGGSVDRTLDERARRDAESAPAAVTARAELAQARTERAELDRTVAAAQGDIEQALIVARCEYNPTPECPQTKITGVPGQGPEAQTANAMLDDARARLVASQARVRPLDDRIAGRQQDLDRARAGAVGTGDRGLGARWLAMNDYTTGHAGGLLLRFATLAVGVVLALLPLLVRWWRGETSFERRMAARAVVDRAEQDAAAAIAIKRAEVRAEAESLRADQELAATRLAAHADTAIDRERQRTRIVAALGNFEIGITEPARRAVADFETLAELPPAPEHRQHDPVPREATMSSSGLPARPSSGTGVPPAKKEAGLELPVIGTVPFSDTAARWIRPLVPSFVANAVGTATHPLRTVRHAIEEAEEITFTLRRTRKVTVHSDESGHGGPAPGSDPYAQQVASRIVDAQDPARAGLTTPNRYDAVAARTGAREFEHRDPRQLPPPGRD
ncbi:DUF4407 domain-containing protein [Nocardia sp. BMG51109]|uniref:DUF4407 domain-containing protein n=1 Tax=Nocardia sp. BMG51109 TaxID=1056816 RepID=UPI000467D6E8|nr:DUF4407 domain-containing protein [Nocardia sp. BMG51109]